MLDTGDVGGKGAGISRGEVANDGEPHSIVAYHWSFVSLNGKSASTFTKAAAATDANKKAEPESPISRVQILTPDKQKTVVEGLTTPGKYVFQLIVTDNHKHTAKDTVSCGRFCFRVWRDYGTVSVANATTQLTCRCLFRLKSL